MTMEGQQYCNYARLRNQAKWECDKAKKDFEKKLAKEVKDNPKAFYKYASTKMKTRVTVCDLKKQDGNMTTTDKEKAEALNDFFSSVFTQEDLGNIPTFEERKFESILEDVEITEDIVRKRLASLKVNKSAGPDGIHPRMLRELADVLAVPVCILFKRSLSESLLPEDWKRSHITPIFKSGERIMTSNYRPVSLTAVLCKVLESILRESIFEHMSQNGLITDCQHGFMKGRSCVTQLLEIMDMWTRVLDQSGNIDVVYLDFRKAFDTVPHERLMKKIEGYGIRGNVLGWLRAFLTDREQRVIVNGEMSDWAPVTSGIPQGSVLGPVMFILYINDMPDVVHSLIRMFADDTKIFREIACKNDCMKLQKDLDTLVEWSACEL